jgi:thiamine pyrophosphokinase
MSSHHIVREKQEPALLVLGMDNFTDEQLGQLLEWSPTVITTPLTAEQLISFGIKVDWIITDDDSADLQSDIKQLTTNGLPITEAALKYLVTHGYPAVNVVTDEFDLQDYIAFAAHINLVIFFDQQKIYTVNPGFSKWKPAGEIIKVLASADNLQFFGLEKIADNTFKTIADGFFSLQFNAPYLFIAEAL